MDKKAASGKRFLRLIVAASGFVFGAVIIPPLLLGVMGDPSMPDFLENIILAVGSLGFLAGIIANILLGGVGIGNVYVFGIALFMLISGILYGIVCFLAAVIVQSITKRKQ